jgi:hypothetical protein
MFPPPFGYGIIKAKKIIFVDVVNATGKIQDKHNVRNTQHSIA